MLSKFIVTIIKLFFISPPSNNNFEGNMANVNTSLTTINNNLNTANTNINNVKSTVGTVNTNVSSILNNVASILNKINAGTSVIKSIQRGTVSMSSGSATATKTISSVNINKSIILFDSCRTNEYDDSVYHADFVNSTTIQFYKASAYASVSVGYTVIEFI